MDNPENISEAQGNIDPRALGQDDSNSRPEPEGAPQQPQFAKVDVNFLQAILDYLMTKPYAEVHQFVDVLMKGNRQPKG